MTARRVTLALALAAVLVAAGFVVASNMGLMRRIPLSQGGSEHWVSLPYRSAIGTAQELCDAVGPTALLVARFDVDEGGRNEWSCPGGTNFTIQPGEGVVILVGTPTTLTLVGSHDPELAVPPGGFAHTDRDYLISIPYHSTALTASDLCDQIPSAGVISRFEPTMGSTQDWTCPFGTNFPLRVGEAVRVQVKEPSEGFVPEVF